jgi:hypothetical protein
MRRLAGESGEISADLSGAIQKAQRRAERHQVLLRRRLFAHDEWLENVLHDFNR